MQIPVLEQKMFLIVNGKKIEKTPEEIVELVKKRQVSPDTEVEYNGKIHKLAQFESLRKFFEINDIPEKETVESSKSACSSENIRDKNELIEKKLADDSEKEGGSATPTELVVPPVELDIPPIAPGVPPVELVTPPVDNPPVTSDVDTNDFYQSVSDKLILQPESIQQAVDSNIFEPFSLRLQSFVQKCNSKIKECYLYVGKYIAIVTNQIGRNMSDKEKNARQRILVAVGIFFAVVIVAGLVIAFVGGDSAENVPVAVDIHAPSQGKKFTFFNKKEGLYKSLITSMVSGATKAEECSSLVRRVWYNSINREYDYETNKYTFRGGIFCDFEIALSNLYDDELFRKEILEIEENQQIVARDMKALQKYAKKDPVTYELFLKQYQAYLKVTRLAVKPSGSLLEYGTNCSDASSEFLDNLAMLNLHIN
jgi:hypothetical protein